MSELFKRGKFLAGLGRDHGQKGETLRRVAIVGGAIGGSDRVLSLAALFPNAQFESVGMGRIGESCDVIIAPLDSRGDIETEFSRLAASGKGAQIVIALQDADVTSTRRLIRAGAADVLPAPVTELALTLCLERLFDARTGDAGGPSGGQIVSFLKAGGGVGATSLIAQLAASLAGQSVQVGAIDLDLQFGCLALYLDLADAYSVTDFLGAETFEETLFETALAKHLSGARVMAAPRDLTPLEAVTPQRAEALMAGLRRCFDLTLIDLPSVWTAWTNRALQLTDQIVLVTNLSVAHVTLVKRQLQVLNIQGFEGVPLKIVCNALSGDQQETLSLKAAERALGRPFDVVLPYDSRTMNSAINQGVELSAVRRGTKLEKALAQMAADLQSEFVSASRTKR